MGGTSKFKFPMPHRRSRQPTLEVQTISSPMTNKAHKLLGSAELNIDPSPTSSIHDPSRLWDTRSAVSGVSGISVTISETTATGTVTRTRSPLSTLDEDTVAPNSRSHIRAWDQESDIIPKGLGFNGSSAGRTQNLDTITDASSVRRRRSSSTIASFYDKTKLPLSISQQTSNSAMAKGPPNKAQVFLDMDHPRPAPSPPNLEKKKLTKLDMTHLLPTPATPSRNPLTRLTRKRSMAPGPDMLTRSSSIKSTPPAVSPSEAEPKMEKKPRRKLTRESLRSLRSLGNRNSTISTEESETASLHKRVTDAGTLHQLYQHYENTSFRDIMTPEGAELQEESPHGEDVIERDSRAGSQQNSQHSSISSAIPTKMRQHVSSSSPAVSRHHFSPNSTFDAISEMPLSASNPALASPPTDYAGSVSSRHTRTSKASKWTDQSFTDFDPNANSVLSLSSDSEDELSEPPRAVSAPSIASMESTSSPPESRRPSNTSQESVRKQLKSKFRPSLNPQGHFLAIPENMKTAGTAQPAINPRTSSLASALASAAATSGPQPNTTPSTTTTTSSARSLSRLSQVSTSTCESTTSQSSRPRPPVAARQAPEIRHVAMFQSRAAPTGRRHHEPAIVDEKPHASPKKLNSSRISQPTPPISPSSMEFAIQTQDNSTTEKEGPVLTLNGTGGVEDERFMAVTKQEELLLAAMRARRALMREGNQVADIKGMDRGRAKDDRSASKKESLSSIKTLKAGKLQPPPTKSRPSDAISNDNAITMLFPNPPSGRSSPTARADDTSETDSGKQEEVLVCLDRTTSPVQPLEKAEPITELSDFMRFESEQFPAPPVSKPSHSRASPAPTNGINSRSASVRQKSTPRRDSEFMPSVVRPSSVQGYRKPETSSRSTSRSDWHPAEVEPVIERPESSSSFYESEPESQPPHRMKAVRISAVGIGAVGTQLPEIGQWGDDG